jgi:ribose 5-phosphate isomerase A
MNDADRLATLAREAVALVEDGMRLGLGSGSTAEACIAALGERIAGGLRVSGVATSHRTAARAREAGIDLVSLEDTPVLDLGFDGADEIDSHLDLVKGRGGALLYEKVVAGACERWVVVAASEKLVEQLGTRIRLPVEIIPFGWSRTRDQIAELGLEPDLRTADDGDPFLTDGGHFILDCATGPIAEPYHLADRIKRLTGVIDHGLFLGCADQLLTVDTDGTVTSRNRPGHAGVKEVSR